MIKKYWDRFNEWPTTHFICIGTFIGFVRATPETFITFVGSIVLLCTIVYWPLKALCITGNTIATWDTKRDGPMFKVGDCLTEYDETRARRQGEYAGKAMARELRRYEQEKRENQ